MDEKGLSKVGGLTLRDSGMLEFILALGCFLYSTE